MQVQINSYIFLFIVLGIFFAVLYVHDDGKKSVHVPFIKREFLAVTQNSFGIEVGPVNIIDIGSGEIKSPKIQATGCGGVVFDQNKNELFTYCAGTEKAFWDIDIEKNTTSLHQKILAPDGKGVGVPIHSRIQVSTAGWHYFNDGGPTPLVNGEVTDASVVMVKDDQAEKIYISDRTMPYFIFRFVLDESAKKLWVMSIGSGVSVLIDRIDLEKRAVDLSLTIPTYSGFDMVLDEKSLIVSTYRTDEGKDVTIFNKNTGEKEKEIRLPHEEDFGFNALSLITHNNDIFISSMGGMYVLSSRSYEVVDFIENNPGSFFTYFVKGNDSIYAIDAYNKVLKIPINDLAHPKLIYEAEGKGLTSLYHFVNR